MLTVLLLVSVLPAEILTADPVLAKTVPNFNSAITFAGAKNYGGLRDDIFRAVAQTKDGGYVAVGYSRAASTDPVWGNGSVEGSAINDGVVVKFNSRMKVEWAQNYGRNEADVFFDVDVLENGTIVAVGTSDFPRQTGNLKLISAWVVMIDPDDPGSYKELFPSGTRNDYLQGVCALPNNEFAVFGYGYSKDAVWKNTTGAACGILVRYDAEGNIKYAVSSNIGGQAGLTTLKNSRFFDGCVDKNGDLIAVGDIQLGDDLVPSQIVKFDGDTGKMIWGKFVGTTRTEKATDLSQNHISCLTGIDVLADGSYVTVGYSKKTRYISYDYVTEENLAAIGKHDSVVLRYSTAGKCLNSEIIGTLDRTVDLGTVCATADGGYFIGGSSDSRIVEGYLQNRGYTFKNSGGHDFLLIKYDSKNKCVWSANYGGTGNDYIHGILIAKDGNLIGVGEADSQSSTPVYGNNGRVDATVFATFPFGSGTASIAEPSLVGSGEPLEENEEEIFEPYEHEPMDVEAQEDTEEPDNTYFFESLEEESDVIEVSAAQGDPADTYYSLQKRYYSKIGVPTFWERNLGGKGVTLAVIDNGFTPAHQDIDYSRVLPAIDCTSGKPVAGGMEDLTGHGTGILGELIAIRSNNMGLTGLLSDVTIAPIKVKAEKGSTADIEAAIYAAVDKCNASVISMSFGDTDINTKSFKKAIDYAVSKNVILVAAAGDSGTSSLYYPAAFDNVIGVGFTDANYTASPYSQRNDSIDVVAPGIDIYMPYPSRYTHCTIASGSSYAVPFVAAMAAAAKQMNPDITHDKFLKLLRETSMDRGAQGYDTTYGNGVVNFDAFAKKITFSDVLDPGKWYYESVYWAYNNGITSGYGEGTFKPNENLNRAQAVTFLYNIAGKPDVSNLNSIEFTDVPKSAWYYNAVKWAAANEITSGYGPGKFQPNATCNRAMIVTFLMNYAKVVGTYKEPMTSSNFKDVAANAWYKTSVDWAVENGITSGYGQGTFSPNVTCNRAMMVAFLKKVSEMQKA